MNFKNYLFIIFCISFFPKLLTAYCQLNECTLTCENQSINLMGEWVIPKTSDDRFFIEFEKTREVIKYSSIGKRNLDLDIYKKRILECGFPKQNYLREFNYQKGKVKLLKNGVDSFSERMKLISNAKKNITLETFIFKGDEAGLKIGQALIERKQNDNLDINVHIDTFNFYSMNFGGNKVVRENTYRLFRNFMAAGIYVEGAPCHKPKAPILKEFVKRGKKTLYHYHEKTLIADQNLAILGGLNYTNKYFKLGLDKWTDVDLAVKGDIVKEIYLDLFSKFTKKEKVIKSCLNPYVVGSKDYLSFFHKYKKDYIDTDHVKNSEEYTANQNIEKVLSGDDQSQTHFHSTKISYIRNRPLSKKKGQGNDIEQFYIKAINAAKWEVLIANSYFIPSQNLRKAILKARRRGVRVKVLTNSRATNDVLETAILSQYNYKKLKPGISNNGQIGDLQIIEYKSDYINDDTPKKLKRKYQGGLFHAKYAIIDRQIGILGSFNIDPLSRNYNSEEILILRGGHVIKDMISFFFEFHHINKILDTYQIQKYHHPRGVNEKYRLFKAKVMGPFL